MANITEQTRLILASLANLRAITPKSFKGSGLIIELGQEIMPTNNITKFDDDPLKNTQVTERTRFILAILANSRTISASRVLADYRTWPRYFANKYFHCLPHMFP